MKYALKHFEKIVGVLFVVAVVLLLRERLPHDLPETGNIVLDEPSSLRLADQLGHDDRICLNNAFRASQWYREDFLVTRFATVHIAGWRFSFIADPFNRKWRLWSSSHDYYERVASVK